ncbi:hypothetical protein X801_00058, partial [Opisthorchis viverrini]
MVRYKISNQLSSQERTKFTETRNGLSWRHTPFDTSIKLVNDCTVGKVPHNNLHGEKFNIKNSVYLAIYEKIHTRLPLETELRATGPTVQWREVSDENDIPLYNRPTDRLCDWVLGKLWLIWSNFCVKKIICSGRVGETTASVKIYSPSRIYRHLCPDMEDKGTREFALKQLNSPPEVLNGVSFKFI